MGAPKTLGFLRYFNNRRLKQPLRFPERYHRWDIYLVNPSSSQRVAGKKQGY